MKETSGSQLGDIFERDVLKVDYDAPKSNRHERKRRRRSPTEKTIEMEIVPAVSGSLTQLANDP